MGVREAKLNILNLIVSIGICELAGVIGSIFTFRKIPTWYASLKKPSFRPPNWLFGPVWTTLYLLMGIAAYLIWQDGIGNSNVWMALAVFGIQLGLNVLWSVVFFGMESPSGGIVVIFLLWGAILASIVLFLPISITAGVLLLPYILWVSFAAGLNVAIYRLNRD
jgi:benzodiazapine receptor